MIRLDKVDHKIIELLKNREMNLSGLWIGSFSKEGQKTFKERLYRLEELKVISIEKMSWKHGFRYTMRLINERS